MTTPIFWAKGDKVKTIYPIYDRHKVIVPMLTSGTIVKFVRYDVFGNKYLVRFGDKELEVWELDLRKVEEKK